MIDLSPADETIVNAILKKHIAKCEVRAFGSRHKWTAKSYSDLDLAIVGTAKLDKNVIYALQEAFEESELSFRVDVLDWYAISDEFRQIIEQGYTVIQEKEIDNQLPAGWTVKRLGDVVDIVMGQSPNGAFCNNNGDGTPLLNGPTEFTHKYPKPVQFTSHITKQSKIGDILFCVRGSTTGKMNWADKNYVIGRGLAAIRHTTDTSLNPFIKALIEQNLDVILSSATGSTFPNVSRDLLDSILVNVPPIDEQKEIAAILSSLDDKIELNRQTNQTLEEMAQSIFKEWFIDFNFPDENGNPYRDSGGLMIDSELGQIPASWSVGKLGSMCEVISKGTTPTSLQIENLDKNIPFIKVKDIAFNGTINISGLDLIPDEVHKKVLKRSILKTGDILFSIAGTIGRVSILPENLNNSNCNQAVAFIRLKDREYLEFIHQHLISQNIQGLILGSVVQGVQANVSLTTLGNIPVIFPDKYSLLSFNCLIKPVYKKNTDNDTQISSAICIRDTLLPKLMSGNITRIG